MLSIAVFNAAVVLLGYLASKYRSDILLSLSFAMIYLLMALRFDYGNDYWGYLEGFYAINSGASLWGEEPGWVYLCHIFEPFGFFSMIAFIAAINCYVYFRFIRKYVPAKYYWLSLFVFVFNPDFMLIQLSAMRQSMAISIYIISLDYIYKNNVIIYSLLIVLASTFHQSALIMLPLYFIVNYEWGISTQKAILISVAYVSMFAFMPYIQVYIKSFVGDYFTKYEVYQTAGILNSGLGMIYYMLLLVLVLLYYAHRNSGVSIMYNIYIVGFFMIPIGLFISMIARVKFYFNSAELIVMPIVYSSIQDKMLRRILLFIYVIITVYFFYSFFHSDIWRYKYGEYRTIWSSPQIY